MSGNYRLDQYKGRLTPSQIAEGINRAFSNAIRLVQDAELLCQNQRYPSAVGLAILAIEESGKVAVLRRLAVARNEVELKECWKGYRTHTEKSILFPMPDLVLAGAKTLEEFRPMFSESEFPQVVENLKQLSLYTDCLASAHWSTPVEVADEELAKKVLSIAKSLIGNEREVTEKEMELWIKHIGPVWKAEMEMMKTGLRNYFIELHRLGLLKGKIEDCLAFVDGKKDWVH